MIVTEEQKNLIEKEFAEWEAQQYAGKTKEERQKMAQFFTPPVLSIKMAEKFDTVIDKDILDPTVGAGGLLVVCLICGADPKRVYGIELDPAIANVARQRLAKFGVPRHHIHIGNALDPKSYEFPKPKYSYRLSTTKQEYGKIIFKLEIFDQNGTIVKSADIESGTKIETIDKNKIRMLKNSIEKLIDKECEELDETEKSLLKLNVLCKYI